MMLEELAEEVRKAAGRPEVRAAVRDLYDRLQMQIDQRKPICTASGKCCHFDAYGHRLYVTTIELAAFVSQLPERRSVPANPLSLPIAPAPSDGGCPFQVEKLCTVHAIRPFGCRIFYCDPTATDWQQEQYETFHGEIKKLHELLGVAYQYVEWREAVKALGLPG